MVAAAAAACGSSDRGQHPSSTKAAATWTQRECAFQADAVAGAGHQILLHYGSQSSYPADLGYFLFRNAFVAFTGHGCRSEVLGATLRRQLTPRQRAELLSHLPTTLAQSVRRVLVAGGSS